MAATRGVRTGRVVGGRGATPRLRPAVPPAPTQLDAAVEHFRAGRLPEAERLCRRALDREPRSADALHLLGLVVHRAGHPELAVRFLERAADLDPTNRDHHVRLGDVLRDRGRLEDAAASFERAVRADPGSATAHRRLGDMLAQLGRLPRAIAAYRAAILAAPGLTEAYRDLAAVLVDAGRSDEAVATCRRGLALAGDDPALHVRLGTALLSGGDLEAGLAEYEWRRRCPEYDASALATEAPRWEGWPLDGRTILLHAEHDLGDTLRFARYAPLLEESGGRVVVACQPELVTLLGRVDGVSEVVPLGGRLPPHSTWAPLPSLPRLLDTTPETVPSEVPYLHARQDLVAARGGLLAARAGEVSPRPRRGPLAGWLSGEDRLRVGLVWANGWNREDGARHSVAPASLAPLGRVRGAQLIGLEPDAAGRPARERAGLRLLDLGSELEDVEDLAAVISRLDLVITVDGPVAHLAGALGRPVWVLLGATHDWRWERGRDDSPWYPTMRLFRQARADDWEGLVERVAAELAVFAAATEEE